MVRNLCRVEVDGEPKIDGKIEGKPQTRAEKRERLTASYPISNSFLTLMPTSSTTSMACPLQTMVMGRLENLHSPNRALNADPATVCSSPLKEWSKCCRFLCAIVFGSSVWQREFYYFG